jgi:L-arabinonolactonase
MLNETKGKVGHCLKVLPADNILGENVLWHVQQQAIYWIDIEGSLLLRYVLANGQIERFKLPQRIGSFAFLDSQSSRDFQIIAAFAQGFALYNFESGAIRWLHQLLKHGSGLRFNDGRVDRDGHFWAGSMIEDEALARQKAALYRLALSGQLEAKLDGLQISNGLCWSPDGRTLYHCDSPLHQIHQYDYCPGSGVISNKKLFTTTAENAHPDGSTVDGQSCVWSALWGAGKIARYSPRGELLLQLDVPVSQPSSVAIGGPAMDWLLVTSSKLGLNDSQLAQQADAGHVFIYQLQGISGIAESHCHIATD